MMMMMNSDCWTRMMRKKTGSENAGWNMNWKENNRRLKTLLLGMMLMMNPMLKKMIPEKKMMENQLVSH